MMLVCSAACGRRKSATRGVGASITDAVGPFRLALIRPGLRPAHLPPQGKAIGKTCVAYVEKYRSNNANIPK